MKPIEIRFDPPAKAWSVNEERRMHWAEVGKLVAEWRMAGKLFFRRWAIKAEPGLPLPPSIVTVTLPVPTNHKRDPSNYLPAVKGLVDGLVDGGAWPDDDATWVTVSEPKLRKGGQVIVRIEERGDE